ncbi:MAG TPA: AsmA-like C-terminal region-containing protein [Accumulibacter sp.]|jgi:hypothetical protein|nr:AsmA-like C-terminal region-containing protein [Accumulibacter sp.]HQC80076.1 AsmA-like C-terminal region-containing protein [Accumulibacter sp.]
MNPEEIDKNLVYAKSAIGEDAILNRTQIAQRNLRMVLILVDGNATVAELCAKTGDPQRTRVALAQLEREGFIEPRIDNNSVWPLKRLARRDTPPREVSAFSTYGTDGSNPPAPMKATPPPIVPFPGMANDDLSSFSRPRATASQRRVIRDRHADHPDSFSTVFVPKNEAERVGGVNRGPTNIFGQPDTRTGPRQRHDGNGPGKRWLKIAIMGIGLLGALLVLLVLFFPYTRYLPNMERAIEQVTGRSTRIENMRVAFYPKPALRLTNVQLGKDAGGSDIRIGELRLQPTIGSLLSYRVAIREIELSRWTVSAEALASLASILESESRGSKRLEIKEIAFDQTEIAFGGLSLPNLRGQATLAPTGLLQAVSLSSPDRKFHFDAAPDSAGLAFQVHALAWRATENSPYLFDSISLKGHLDRQNLAIENMEFRIFDGVVTGNALLNEAPLAKATGEISFNRIDIGRFCEAVGIGRPFQGDAKGKLRFSANPLNGSLSLSDLRAEGGFTLSRGSLTVIDLPEAIRRASATPRVLGGGTRFDQLTGVFNFTPTNSRFTQLALSAGLLQATGQLDISRNQQLRGAMSVTMGRTTSGPVDIGISGPLSSPSVQAIGH